jgi:hypothetical protein
MPKLIGARRSKRPRRDRITNTDAAGAITKSVRVPRSDYLSTHVAGVSQHLRRTLVWTYAGEQAANGSTTYEPATVILNSPYDPDAALGGTSATGFAKYMAYYSKCFVIGARIKARYALSSTAGTGYASQVCALGLTITTLSGAMANALVATQAGLCDYRLHNINPDSGMLEMSVDIGKFLDKPQVLDDPQLFCTSGANPGQVVVGHLWIQGFDSAITTLVMSYFLEVEYDCVFTDPIPFT